MDKKTQNRLVGLFFLALLAWLLIRVLPFILSLTANLLSLLIILLVVGLLLRSGTRLFQKFLK